ncbi:nuclear transport factor 2 family protein [Rhizobium skierniewicense]|uniref:nuclear transport factor 2 family protein n=1 Tax=Rhizobium skierniewicense TaxID=984260 RepID=UPI0015736EAF|nr:nuclear transport factor 2 family protein [Rhizobium skierniewicense]NTF32372.1 nuclear transport factor 2 family protein [Rhizobium skierniewicense]
MAETITQTVTDYVQAMTDGDASLLRAVFDPRANIVGNYEGATDWLSLEDFIHQIRSSDQGQTDNPPQLQILGIDQTGDTASVKLTTRLAGMDFCEYLSLLRRDKNWTIIHRLYYLNG